MSVAGFPLIRRISTRQGAMTQVIFGDGREITLMGRLGKREAIKQALWHMSKHPEHDHRYKVANQNSAGGKRSSQTVAAPSGDRCYACDAAAKGWRDMRPEGGAMVPACGRHRDPSIKTFDACIYCGAPVRKGSVSLGPNEYAHAKCEREQHNQAGGSRNMAGKVRPKDEADARAIVLRAIRQAIKMTESISFDPRSYLSEQEAKVIGSFNKIRDRIEDAARYLPEEERESAWKSASSLRLEIDAAVARAKAEAQDARGAEMQKLREAEIKAKKKDWWY